MRTIEMLSLLAILAASHLYLIFIIKRQKAELDLSIKILKGVQRGFRDQGWHIKAIDDFLESQGKGDA